MPCRMFGNLTYFSTPQKKDIYPPKYSPCIVLIHVHYIRFSWCHSNICGPLLTTFLTLRTSHVRRTSVTLTCFLLGFPTCHAKGLRTAGRSLQPTLDQETTAVVREFPPIQCTGGMSKTITRHAKTT
jgi:hypothetical protein